MQIPLQQYVRMQPKGLLTLPKKWREEVGVEENGMVRITKDKRRLIIEPVRTLPCPVRSYTDSDLNEFYNLDEQETKELKSRGLLNAK